MSLPPILPTNGESTTTEPRRFEFPDPHPDVDAYGLPAGAVVHVGTPVPDLEGGYPTVRAYVLEPAGGEIRTRQFTLTVIDGVAQLHYSA